MFILILLLLIIIIYILYNEAIKEQVTEALLNMADNSEGHMMQIFVKTIEGKTITLDVENTFTIKNIKDIVMNVEAIPSKDQRLLFGNWSPGLQHSLAPQHHEPRDSGPRSN